jgi:BMFP domain-containing protein YqiC
MNPFELPNLTEIITYVISISLPLYTFYVSTKLDREYNKSINQFSTMLDNNILNRNANKLLIDNNQKYKESIDSKNNRTFEDANDYFNYDIVINALGIPVKFYSSLPGIFIAIGVLGTFTGLALGLSGINLVSESKVAINQLEILLDGVRSAFLTSIVGMLCSIIFTIIYKYKDGNLSSKLEVIISKLNTKYLYTESELRSKDKEDDFARFNQLLTALTPDGQELTIAQTLMNVQIESNKQSTSLASFSDDLADKIDITFQTVMQTHNENFQTLVTTLVKKFETLSESLSAPAAEMANSVGANMQGAIREMMEELRTTLAEGTKEEIRVLKDSLEATSKSLIKLPDTLSQLMTTVSSNVENNQNILLNAFNESGSQMQESIGLLQKNQSELIVKQNDNLQQNAALIEDLLSKSQEELTNSLELQKNGINASSDSLQEIVKSVSSNFKGNMEENFRVMSEHSNQQIDSIREEFSQISEVVKGLSEQSNALNVSTIERQAEIFEKQESKMLEINQRLNEMMSVSGDQFSAKLSEAGSTINQGFEKQQELVEEIKKLLSAYSLNLTHLDRTTSSISDVQGVFVQSTNQMKDISNLFETISSSTKKTVDELSNVQLSFGNLSVEMLDRTNQAKNVIDELLTRSFETKAELTVFHSEVRDSVNTVFENLNGRIQDYQSVVNQSLSSYLNTYTENVNNVTNQISQTVADLSDAFGDAEFGNLNRALSEYNNNASELLSTMKKFLNVNR